jgi:hypothetical protein
LTRLYDLNIGEVAKPDMKIRGVVFSNVALLDPLKDHTSGTNWMLPRHRMQFVMSKLGAGTALGGLISGAARKSQILEEEAKKDGEESNVEQVLPGQADSASPTARESMGMGADTVRKKTVLSTPVSSSDPTKQD